MRSNDSMEPLQSVTYQNLNKQFNSFSFLFLTEEAYTQGSLRTRELGQTPLKIFVSMGGDYQGTLKEKETQICH